MLDRLAQLWCLGSANTEGHVRRRILLSNQLGMLGIFATIPYQLFYLLESWQIYAPVFLSNCLIMLGYGWTLWANHRKRHVSARNFVIGVAITQLLCVSWYLGPDIGVDLFFFTLAAILPLLFDRARATTILGLALLTVILFLICQSDFGRIAGPVIVLPFGAAQVMFACSAIESAILACTFVLLFRVEIDAVETQLVAANAELSALSATDPLTGLPNRRGLDIWLGRQLGRRSSDAALGLIIVDIDDFKAFNDQYGHPAGDRALRRVADAMAASIRPDIDIAVRQGGEEFLVLATGAELSDTRDLAMRLLDAVRDLNIEHTRTRNGQSRLTISAGYDATEVGSSAQVSSLIASADRALYRAKQDGRNRAAGRTPDASSAASQA